MRSFLDVLEGHVITKPNDRLFVFLDEQGEEVEILTYREFALKVKNIAAFLQKKLKNKVKGSRVLLLYEPGLEFICGFFGCIYAGAIAVPAYPPDNKQLKKSLPRLNGIIEDCSPSVIFTNSKFRKMLRAISFISPKLLLKPVIGTDKIDITLNKEWKNPRLISEDIAFLQYTSGSTSIPKGVMVTHGNMVNNSELVKQNADHDSKTKILSWLPLYHDMGLGNALQALYLGSICYLFSPISFIKNPIIWLKTISKYKINTSGGPNFAFNLCINRINVSNLTGIDLSSWKISFCGAEPIRKEVVDKFFEKFKPFGLNKNSFHPCYGLAEATVFVTGKDRKKYIEQELTYGKDVTCGVVGKGHDLIIADPDSRIKLEENKLGEIWFRGPSVAKGYWQKSELTTQIFNAYTLNGEGPYLRTGDKGFLHQNELYVVGRIKDLIIINGKNYYPQDIEITVEKMSKAIRSGCVAAFSVERNAKEELIVVAEVNQFFNTELIEKIKEEIRNAHELLVYEFIPISARTIPKTSSGKIQRFMCKQLYLKGQLKSVLENELKRSLLVDSINLIKKLNVNFLSKSRRNNSIAITSKNIEKWFIEKLASELKTSSDKIDIKKPISSYLDSVTMVTVANDLSQWLKSNFDPFHFFGSNSIESISKMCSKDSVLKIAPVRTFKQFDYLNNIKQTEMTVVSNNVFLTGATGVLGSYILKELLCDQTIKNIYCLVRGNNSEECLSRLRNAVNIYDDSLQLQFSKKVIPIVGDITSVNFNLKTNEYESLKNKIDVTIHAASSTNLFLSYELLKQTNVLGTQRVIDFSLHTRQKYLIYISSYSIMGDLIKRNSFVFFEKNFYLGQTFDRMGYQETKFEAESLVRQASINKGLNFNIMRPGNIFGDSQTGNYPFNTEGVSHLYYEILDMIIETKIASKARMIFDITPVDYVAKAVLCLGLRRGIINGTYHLLNPDVKSWVQIVKMIISEGFEIKLLPLWRYFLLIASEKVKFFDPRFNKLISLMRYGFADYRFFNSRAYCSSKHTANILEKYDIHCSPINNDLIKMYVNTYKTISKRDKNLVNVDK